MSTSSKYSVSDHEASHKVLWNGDYLDGRLTIVFCPCCNEEHPSDIPDTVIMDFTLLATDGTEFAGQAAVTMNKEGIEQLLCVINEAYCKFIIAGRREYQCQLH